MPANILQLSTAFTTLADAVVAAAPNTPEKAQLVAECQQARDAYFRARYESQRVNFSRIQR